jgi:hypothetical protein
MELQGEITTLKAMVASLQARLVPGISEALEISLRNEIAGFRNEIAGIRQQLASAQQQGIY